MIKISSKFKKKKYYHAERLITFDRVCGALAWPGDKKGFVVIVGESKIFSGGLNRFILAESMRGSFGELLADAVKLQQRFDIKRWHSINVPGSENYTDIFNRKAFDAGEVRLVQIDEPMDANDYIQVSTELIDDGLRVGNKTLHFFKDSVLPAELQNFPTITNKLKITDFPAIAALGYAISYLDEFKAPAAYVPRANYAY